MSAESSGPPGWVSEILSAINSRHNVAPDVMTQARQWIGLVIASGALLLLVQAARSAGHIEADVATNGAHFAKSIDRLDEHIRQNSRDRMDLADILRLHEARTARLEGIEEARRD